MPVQKTCEQCGQFFAIKPSKADQRFCTFQCKAIHETTHGRPAAQVPVHQFACKECNRPFFYKPAYLKEYRKKFGKDPMYCSRDCSNIGRRKDADERNKFNCKNCGKETYRTRREGGGGNLYYEQKLCCTQCKNEWVSKIYREKHGLPQITRRMRRHYVTLRIPAQNGEPVQKDVLEHRYVMEQKLSRKLTVNETVHHINGIKTDNRPENLELFSSRHGPGQRVIDKVAFGIEMIRTYPEFLNSTDVETLRQILNSVTVSPSLELPR